MSSPETINDVNTATNMRLIVTKAVLWFLLGIAAVLALLRIWLGGLTGLG